MSRAAAIIAAVLSVITGGPLRCPCHLAALFLSPSPAVRTTTAAPPKGEAGRCDDQRCSCKTHREPAPPEQPTEQPTDQQKPAPGVPCQHCPNVDLAPPAATGERLAGDRDPGDWSADSPASAPVGTQTLRPDTLVLIPGPVTPSAPDRLRYCHSFRC